MRLKGKARKAARNNSEEQKAPMRAPPSVPQDSGVQSQSLDQIALGPHTSLRKKAKAASATKQDANEPILRHLPSGRRDLSGTIFSLFAGVWMVGKHLNSDFHYDEYSLIMTTTHDTLKLLDLTCYRVRSFNFDEVSPSIAKFRRRHMNRFAKYRHVLFPSRHDGVTYMPYLVNDAVEAQRLANKKRRGTETFPEQHTRPPSADLASTHDKPIPERLRKGGVDVQTIDSEQLSSNNIHSRKETARIKQLEKRQRRRSEKHSKLENQNHGLHREGATERKRRQPNPIERSRKFLVELCEFDNPDLSAFPGNVQSFELAFNASKSLRAITQDNIENKEFRDFTEMEQVQKDTMAQLEHLEKQRKNAAKVSRANNDDHLCSAELVGTSLHNTKQADPNGTKMAYAILILPRLLQALEARLRAITARLKQASQTLDGNPAEAILGRDLQKTVRGLTTKIGGLLPLSPSWKAATAEKERLEKQLFKLSVASDESWERYTRALSGKESTPGQGLMPKM